MSHREGLEFHLQNHVSGSCILLQAWSNIQIFAFGVICPNDLETFLRNSGGIVLPRQQGHLLSDVLRDENSLPGWFEDMVLRLLTLSSI